MAVQLVLIADSSIPEATLRASTSTAVETLNLSQATSPARMSSAPFVWRQDGRPDWRAMWSDFCGLALFGGPPIGSRRASCVPSPRGRSSASFRRAVTVPPAAANVTATRPRRRDETPIEGKPAARHLAHPPRRVAISRATARTLAGDSSRVNGAGARRRGAPRRRRGPP